MTITADDLPKGKQERILVVEDDPMVRDFYADALGKFDYQVTLAEHGRAGIESYQQALAGGNPFELVIMDMRMPEMDGRTCARHLLRLNEQARILVISGSRDLDLEFLDHRLSGLITKPVGLTQLLAAVRVGLSGGRIPHCTRINQGLKAEIKPDTARSGWDFNPID
jgi:CheY-like chemotaxis protein